MFLINSWKQVLKCIVITDLIQPTLATHTKIFARKINLYNFTFFFNITVITLFSVQMIQMICDGL